jgi:hypothetical protein
MTPYAVSELVYDWRAIETDRVKLAVVARETLDEARGFADGHGFTARRFRRDAPAGTLSRRAALRPGKSAEGLSFSDDGIAFGPDTFGQEPEEEAEAPRQRTKTAPRPKPTRNWKRSAGHRRARIQR